MNFPTGNNNWPGYPPDFSTNMRPARPIGFTDYFSNSAPFNPPIPVGLPYPYNPVNSNAFGYSSGEVRMPMPDTTMLSQYGSNSPYPSSNIGYGAVNFASSTVPPVLGATIPTHIPAPPTSYAGASQYPNIATSHGAESAISSSYSSNPNGSYSGYCSYGSPGQYQGTVREHLPFDSQADAKALKKAMKGIGADEKSIIDILTRRTNKQRLKIALDFKTLYGKDLIREIRSELSGCFEDLMCALLLPPDEYDATELCRSIEGLGTDEECLIEILSTRSNKEIHSINNAYKVKYRRSLEQDIIGDTSGHFRRLMVSMSSGYRDESNAINQDKARQDALALFNAGVNRWGTDESTFNSILAYQNAGQLRLVFEEYHRLTGHSMETAIKREMSGDLEAGMLAIVKTVKNRAAFFAERLYKSMKGLGTRDRTLIRIVVNRSEIDMVQIKQEFLKSYGKTLESFITNDTSGDYRKALLSLVSGQF